MPNQIDMANRALIQVGAREQIIAFTERSVSAISCNVLFQPTFEALGRAAHWNCLRAQVILTLLKAAQGTPENQDGTVLPLPPQPWLYEYALPTDCLKIRYLSPTFNQSASGVPIFPTSSSIAPYVRAPREQINFAVATDKDSNGTPQKVILTNLSQAQTVYTANYADPDLWDSQFQAAFVASLAAFLIPALNLNMQLLSMQTKIADGIIEAARASDGNEGVVSQNRDADWIVARGAGRETIYGSGYGGYGCGGWDQMSWPG